MPHSNNLEAKLLDLAQGMMGDECHPISVVVIAEFIDREGNLMDQGWHVGSASRLLGLARWYQVRLEARIMDEQWADDDEDGRAGSVA